MLIKHYLITGRKYALIKECALNKHVRLLTRLYGMYLIPRCAQRPVPMVCINLRYGPAPSVQFTQTTLPTTSWLCASGILTTQLASYSYMAGICLVIDTLLPPPPPPPTPKKKKLPKVMPLASDSTNAVKLSRLKCYSQL